MNWSQLTRDMLEDLVQSMYKEGLINDDFYVMQAKKTIIRPDYVVQAITNYCTVCQGLLNEMSRQINQTEINFLRINIAAHDLYAKNRSIGAEHMKTACMQMMQACQDRNKESCYRALIFIKNEFSVLRKKFDIMLQLEKNILDDKHASKQI